MFIVCPAGKGFSTCSQNVSIGLFTTSSLDFHSEWNGQACVVNHVVYWEQYICPTPASVLFNYGHYTSMTERIVYLPCSHYSCMIDDGSNGTMYLKKRQWFFRKLLHLLRKRRWCKRNFQLMRALSILLLLGGDVELNPGPHQIVLIRRYNSLSKLSTTDEKHLSGLGIPDLHMDCVCHVAVNLSGLSVPDYNMDCVCHVTMKLSGLSVPDCNMDCVCHVIMKLLGLSVPDCNMDYVCHVATGLSGLSIPDVHMEYGYHMHKMELDIGCVPICQEPCCKRDIQLAYMYSLVLLLGGDVELNPGPRQNVVNDTSETTRECDSDKQSTSSENGVDSRLVMLSACQRKRLQNETSAERTSRLARLTENQRQRLANENEEERSARLGRLTDNQAQRLANETEEERTARLDRLADNRARRRQNETEEQRSARLLRLTDNRARRLQIETEEQRSARLDRLADNRALRLRNETEEQRSTRLVRLADNQALRLQNETEEQRSARLVRLADNRARRLENETVGERSERLSQISHKRRMRKQNETSEERATRVSRIAARKQARMSSLSEEERILRQQQQREQTRLRVQALRRKRQQIVELQSSVEPNAVNAENSEGDPSVHLQTPQLVVVAPPNQGTKISGNLVKFRKAILEAPSNKCFSCKKLHYDRLGGTIARDEAGKMLEVVNLSVDDSVGQLWFCNKCKKTLQQKKVPAASQFNNMKVAKVPSALRELNTLEERLIAKATVFMKMVILPRGGQRAVRGQVINFPSDVDGIVSHLPRPPSGEDIVYVQRPDSTTEMESQSVEHGARYLRCRYSRVMEALGWLKRNNPLYEDVIINGVTEDMFDDEDDGNGGSEGEDAHAHSEELQESGVVRLDVLHPNIPAVELLQEENAVHRQVHQLQRVTATPLSIFQDRHNLEVQAFPTLYPNGTNGFGTPRAIKISPLEYFQVRMLSADSRWACHPAYIFWACNIVEAIKLQSSISIALKRSVGEENINPYNEHLLRAWQANMDIQLIGSVYGTAAYVCSYMCKGESEEVRKAIREALQSLPAQASSRKRLSKVGNTMLTHRELSAQEAAYRLCHLPLKENSRKVVFLNTASPEKRTRLLKSRSDLLQLEDDSSDIFIPGIFDRYASRPNTAEFEAMTFAHFAVWYDLDTTRGDATEPTSGRQPRAQLQNGLGWVRLRRKQACLRIPVQTVESHGDDYYYSLLLLYIPWRKEPVDILQGHGSAMEAFLARQNEMVVLNAENHSFADEVQRAVVQLQALQDDAYQDTVAPMAQQVQREDANQPTVEAEGGILNPEHTVDPSWLEGTDGEDGTINADTLHDDDDAIGALSRQTLSERDYWQLVSSLNEHQRVPFDRVVRYTRELNQYNEKYVMIPPKRSISL